MTSEYRVWTETTYEIDRVPLITKHNIKDFTIHHPGYLPGGGFAIRLNREKLEQLAEGIRVALEAPRQEGE